MNLTIEFKKPVQQGSFEWQLSQEINVSSESGEIIAKAEIELITINKHRDALASYTLLDAEDATDWEIPLNLYFKGQNLSPELCQELDITADNKKAKTHLMIEAISVLPQYRNQGVASYLLQEIANKHIKAQSITVLSMPLKWFVEPELCEGQENKHYYQLLDLANEAMTIEQLREYFLKVGFIKCQVDEDLLAEPLPYDILISSPNVLLATLKK